MKITCFVVLIFIILQYSSRAQTATSPKDTTDYGKIFIEAINSESSERQEELVSQCFSTEAIKKIGIDKLKGLVQRFRTNYAPLQYHHSETNEFVKPEGNSYVMHIYAKKQGAVMWNDFQLYLETKLPHKIANLAFIAEVAEPVNLPNGDIDNKYTIQWLTNYIDKLKTENDLYGSILIAKGDKPIFENYFGYADVQKTIPITKSTLFNIASGGKMFTAISIAQLMEGGKLKYDDALTKYLNGFTDTKKANAITIHHLLSHTSGVKEYWNSETANDVYKSTSINDHLNIVYKAGFDFDAGAAYGYSNSNYILLGAIIEKITGTSFYDYVQENIFTKAGMKSSGYFNHGSPNTATPLARGNDEKSWIEAKHGIKGSSAGGAYSTMEDILKFSLALKTHTLSSKATFDSMVEVKTKGLSDAEDYGYGFMVHQRGSLPGAYGHGGTAGGVNFEYRYFPKLDISIILFCNQNNGAYDDLKKNSIKLITGER